MRSTCGSPPITALCKPRQAIFGSQILWVPFTLLLHLESLKHPLSLRSCRHDVLQGQLRYLCLNQAGIRPAARLHDCAMRCIHACWASRGDNNSIMLNAALRMDV